MRLRHKLLAGCAILLILGWASLAIVLSHDSPCVAAAPMAPHIPRMRAIVHRCYGAADVIRLEDIARPAPAEGRVLIRVYATSANPVDWHLMRGRPYIVRAMAGLGAPHDIQLGGDFAGIIEAVGPRVTRYKPGDEVFGNRSGAFAEYVSVREAGALALKPPGLTFEQAAALPLAATTALQALRAKGRLQSGQRVLINGASGGVGTFAVQIAKSFGADVTGVTSTRNVSMVRSLGADQVIDYSREDYTRSSQPYDLILDLVGNRRLLENRRVLKSSGTYIGIGGGGPDEGSFIGTLGRAIQEFALSQFVSQKFQFFVADLNKEDLTVLGDLAQAGRLIPVIDRRYGLEDTAAAIRYLEEGHAQGKVIVSVK